MGGGEIVVTKPQEVRVTSDGKTNVSAGGEKFHAKNGYWRKKKIETNT